MLFNSIDYLVFFPIVFLIYFIVPKKARYLWLLAASYYFYMCWNAQYALLMLTSTLITWLSGLFIGHFRAKDRLGLCKVTVAVSFVSNLAILGFFKYGNFIAENVDALLRLLGMQAQIGRFSLLLPVGISFYTFQALSYTMDVYRGDIDPERNPLRYALFVSFFPQLVAGPIERSKNLLTQIQTLPPFRVDRARRGLLLMAWGLFMKIVLADNIALIIDPIFGTYQQQSGLMIAVAVVLFSFQIYCDFAGYSYIAIGSANVLGFTLMENFKSPYLAKSIGDFWRRWHLSLTTWFRDYLYFPLGGNRRGKARKYLNTMIVFLVSGLWHGADWTFVVWGALNGGLLVLGDATLPLRGRWMARLGIDRTRFSHRLFQRVLTFALINITWLFFRANDLPMALSMVTKLFTDLQLHTLFSPGLLSIFGSTQTAVMLLLALLCLMTVDVLKYRGIDVVAQFQAQGAIFRWCVYLGLILWMLVFGIYGNFYQQTQFLYFQF